MAVRTEAVEGAVDIASGVEGSQVLPTTVLTSRHPTRLRPWGGWEDARDRQGIALPIDLGFYGHLRYAKNDN